MSDAMHGHVTALVRQGDGDQFAADAIAGATTLVVLDVADFSEGGGQLRVGDVVYDYIAIDDDASTITLVAPGLTAPAETDDPVDVWDPEAEATVLEFVATVVDDTTEDVIQAVVEHDLADRMADNIRGLIGESVVCEEDGDGIWVLTRVLGRSPAIDAEYVMVPTPGGGVPLPSTLDDIYAQADAIAEAAQEAANIGTAAQTTANGKNTVTYSADPPGATPNVAGDVWFQRTTTPESPTRPVIIAQYEGQGGTTWESVELSGLVIAYIDAGIITAGSAFVNALQVLTNFTLGDDDQDGVIQSYDFANSDVGVLIHKGGIVAKGGYLAGSEIVGGDIQGGTITGVIINGAVISGGQFESTLQPNGGKVQVTGDQVVITSGGAAAFVVDSSGDSVQAGICQAGGGFSSASAASVSRLFATTQVGVGAADAEFGADGQVVRKGSTERIKRNIRPMTLTEAATVLDVEPVWYQRKPTEREDGTEVVDDTTYPGFIAEQASETADGWVTRDAQGNPDGVRYPEFAVAHNALIRDLIERVERLEAANQTLTARLAKIPGGLTK